MCADEKDPNDLGSNNEFDQSKRAKILLKQIEIGYSNFERRRAYEWKMCLAIWTSIAAFIALIFKGQEIYFAKVPNCLLFVIGISIILIQFFFLYNVKHANDVDKGKAHLCENEINKITGISKEESWKGTFVYEKIMKLKFSGWWSPASQTAITIILLLFAWFVINNSNTYQIYALQKEYSIETETGKFNIKYEGDHYYTVTNWNITCPLPARFRLYPPTLYKSVYLRREQQEILTSLWNAILEDKAKGN